jgi:hypothetical protein
MTIADSRIQLSHLSPALKSIMSAVNAGTATAADIKAAQISLEEKATLESLRATAGARVDIFARASDPEFEALCIDMASVAVTVGAGSLGLTGVASTLS